MLSLFLFAAVLSPAVAFAPSRPALVQQIIRCHYAAPMMVSTEEQSAAETTPTEESEISTTPFTLEDQGDGWDDVRSAVQKAKKERSGAWDELNRLYVSRGVEAAKTGGRWAKVLADELIDAKVMDSVQSAVADAKPPKLEMPKVELPKVEMPKVEMPKAVSMPKAATPKAAPRPAAPKPKPTPKAAAKPAAAPAAFSFPNLGGKQAAAKKAKEVQAKKAVEEKAAAAKKAASAGQLFVVALTFLFVGGSIFGVSGLFISQAAPELFKPLLDALPLDALN